MLAVRAVLAAHARFNRAAPLAFHASGTVYVLPGGSLEATVAVGCGTTVDTALIVVVVLMKPTGAFRAAGTVFAGTAKSTC